MKTIISGSPDFANYPALCGAMDSVGWIVTEVVSAGYGGVHFLAERWAKANGIPVKRFRADRETHGLAACDVRDDRMAEYGDAVIALKDSQSPRLGGIMRKASVYGLRIYIHSVK